MEKVFEMFRRASLTPSEKLIMALFLVDESTLRETNRYIGNFFNITGVTVSNSIRELAKKGFITVSYNSSGIGRTITVNDSILWQ
jgi:DNA-binding MarR family transcriptional regulator